MYIGLQYRMFGIIYYSVYKVDFGKYIEWAFI